jgi:MPN domain-containing protein
MTGKVIDSLWPANNFLTHILQEIDSKLYTVPGTGRTVTLQMLLSANVLTPGKSLMSIEYLVRISRLRRLDLNLTESILLKQGQKFVGDLLPDGKIKSQETETIFCSPSAWAIHCKRIINPDKKSGCGWASVKYKGKKLDVYKATWMRKCQIQRDRADQSPTDGKN